MLNNAINIKKHCYKKKLKTNIILIFYFKSSSNYKF